MPFTRQHIGAIIALVSKDKGCQLVINQDDVPRETREWATKWRLAGYERNNALEKRFPRVDDDVVNPYVESRMCIGISNAVVKCLTNNWVAHHRKKPSWLAHFDTVRNDSWVAGHFAPKFTLSDGKEYVLDWWMTLQVANPVVWQYKDWAGYPFFALPGKGVEFADYRGNY